MLTLQRLDFAKIGQGELYLFKAVPIIFITLISSFSILGYKKVKTVKYINCSFDLVKFVMSNCALLLSFIVHFYVIWPKLVMFYLCKYQLGFTPN